MMRNKAIYAVALVALSGCSKAAADIKLKNTSNAVVTVTYQTRQGGQERRLLVPAGATATLPDTKGGYARVATMVFRDDRAYVINKSDNRSAVQACGSACTMYWRGKGGLDFKAN